MVKLIFEFGFLRRLDRSGLKYLDGLDQNVMEHTCRTILIGYLLAKAANAKAEKVMEMCLFHDLAEARISDLNLVNRKYVTVDEQQAFLDATRKLEFRDELRETIAEYERQESLEAKLAKDADLLELLSVLKEAKDTGHPRAHYWEGVLLEPLKTPEAKELAGEILKTASDSWWYPETGL